jgi:hypothetical protein
MKKAAATLFEAAGLSEAAHTLVADEYRKGEVAYTNGVSSGDFASELTACGC